MKYKGPLPIHTALPQSKPETPGGLSVPSLASVGSELFLNTSGTRLPTVPLFSPDVWEHLFMSVQTVLPTPSSSEVGR